MDIFVKYGLLAVFVSLVTTPVGNPVPEDISLLAAGMLAGMDKSNVWFGLFVGYSGVMLGDCVAWAMGRRVGTEDNGFFARLDGKKQVARITRFYGKYGNWSIVICRQIPGFRLPCFFFAGASGVSIGRFLAIDGTAALVTTNVFFWLGYHFSDDLAAVIPWIERFRSTALVLVGIVACHPRKSPPAPAGGQRP